MFLHTEASRALNLNFRGCLSNQEASSARISFKGNNDHVFSHVWERTRIPSCNVIVLSTHTNMLCVYVF